MTSLPSATFTDYATAYERGEKLPSSISELLGNEATPYQVLQHLVPRSVRRERGTFFTSSTTAAKLWGDVVDAIEPGAVIVDPACGAGDLIWPVAELAARKGLSNITLRVGDIDQDFTRISVARLRQMLGPKFRTIEGVTQNFLTDASIVSDATHVVLNPPYVSIRINEPWASGQANSAAYFTMRALENMKPGARLIALLPDVLRSGTRYELWRDAIVKIASINRLETHDIFDETTDIHVFVLDATVGSSSASMAWGSEASKFTLADFADVKVGAVVPHRDPETGPLFRYLTARSLSAGKKIFRRFSGRKESGPFILVNRTSRPGQEPRVKARLWISPGEVVVENHLLIVSPKKNVEINKLLTLLESRETADFLDNRIRCRHLTVRALKEIPWPE